MLIPEHVIEAMTVSHLFLEIDICIRLENELIRVPTGHVS